MDKKRAGRPVEILVVEDNPGDVLLTRTALAQCGAHYNLTVAQDGLEALAVLRRHGDHGAAARPDIILLDLNLPKMGGREVLAEIKADRELKQIPVVVLSSSRAEQDVASSYELRANSYISKPVDLEEYLAMVQAINDFWLKAATLPSAAGGGSCPTC